MIDERDIWRAAQAMVTRYGGDAVAQSEKRADELEQARRYFGSSRLPRKFVRFRPNEGERVR